MADNVNLKIAKASKNDEFYTMYSDIEAEMNAYYEYDNNVFRDKTILLPCDDPEWSNFTRYFAANFERFGLKKLISTSYARGESNKQLTLFEMKSPRYREDKHAKHGRVYTVTRDINGSGHIDNDDLEFTGYLQGDGDFRSDEVTALRDEADIVITNPPFSLFIPFLAWILEANKQFIILGNKNAITYKEVFPLMMHDKIWLGATHHSGGMNFYVPDSYNLSNNIKIGNDGRRYVNLPGPRWFSNIDHGWRHTPLMLDTKAHNIKYNKNLTRALEKLNATDYPTYYNYDAIEIPITDAIPSDYSGVMGVPITFMDKYNPEQFEIIGYDGNDFAERLGIRAIGEEWCRLYREQGGTGHISPAMHSLVLLSNGQTTTVYKRILIRHKEVACNENNTAN